jgi:antitoxin component YwqK of YwqJK toxin-antitoxin module
MRTAFLFPLLFLSVMTFAQKQVSKTENHLKLPMALWEYYSSDSVSFYYNAMSRLQSYSYCSNNDSGKVPGFSKLQQNLLDAAYLINGQEGGLGYLLMAEGDPAAPGIAALKELGLAQAAKTVEEYADFAKKNAEALTNGDEAIMAKSWYYDSLLIEATTGPASINTMYNMLRNSGMFIRNDGQYFNPNHTGTVRINDKTGNRVEEILVTNGLQTGVSYTSTPNGKPTSESYQLGDWNVNKYYYLNGKLSSYDSTNTNTGISASKFYFPNGKVNTDYSNSYTFDAEGNIASGGSTEKAYYSNGKMSLEIFTNHLGEMKILKAFDQKGRSSVEKGSGKVYRESIDAITGASQLSVTEYSNHIQSGINETYTNGKLTNSFEMQNSIVNGTQKTFHWKNGKLISETFFDQSGGYLEDKNTFEQNAPNIDPSKIKISMELEPDVTCNTHGIWNPKFVKAALANEKVTNKYLLVNYNLLHYNTDNLTPTEPGTTKYLALDIDEQGKVYNNPYEDKDAQIIKTLQFTPASLDGKPIKSRVNIVITTIW